MEIHQTDAIHTAAERSEMVKEPSLHLKRDRCKPNGPQAPNSDGDGSCLSGQLSAIYGEAQTGENTGDYGAESILDATVFMFMSLAEAFISPHSCKILGAVRPPRLRDLRYVTDGQQA